VTLDPAERSDGAGDNDDAVPKALAKAGAKLEKLIATAVEDGIGPLTGAVAYADTRLARARGGGANAAAHAGPPVPGSPEAERAIARILRESALAAGTSGFVSGVGGFTTSLVTVPASAVGNLVINARMAGAVAHLRGYDLDDPHVRTVLNLVVAGSSAQKAAAAVGSSLGKGAAVSAIKALPIGYLRAINRRMPIMLVAKYGTKRAAITLAKLVPWVGGLVGGGVDATLTRSVGGAAKKAFPIT